jgi:hypothetical protein
MAGSSSGVPDLLAGVCLKCTRSATIGIAVRCWCPTHRHAHNCSCVRFHRVDPRSRKATGGGKILKHMVHTTDQKKRCNGFTPHMKVAATTSMP